MCVLRPQSLRSPFKILNESSGPYETAKSLRAQVLPLVEELGIAALKIGMLPTADIVLEVARLLAETDLPAPVIDPVFQSSSGYELMEKEAIEALVTELMPLARLLTPKIFLKQRP